MRNYQTMAELVKECILSSNGERAILYTVLILFKIGPVDEFPCFIRLNRR